MKKLTSVLNATAKYLFIAAVAASFVFFGWRVITKRSYEAQEKLQCEALAASSALSAAEALDFPALAETVQKEGRAEFIVDHMKMPGNYVVKVTLAAEKNNAFRITSEASTGWNSRSPQSSVFEIIKSGAKWTYRSEKDRKFAETIKALKENDATAMLKGKRLVFTYAFEKPCPAPFSAEAAKSSHFSKTPVILLFFAK